VVLALAVQLACLRAPDEVKPARSCTVTFVAGAGGSISGTTRQTITCGASTAPVTAVPDTGYDFAAWTGAPLPAPAANPLVLANVTSDLTVMARFAVRTFTLTFGAGAGGTLTGPTAQTVAYGASAAPVAAVPDAGYRFAAWSGPGAFDRAANPIVVTDVKADQAFSAQFCSITSGPAVTSFSATPAVIARGDRATLSWVATPGVPYRIDRGVGEVAGTTTTVAPTTSTTYTLTAGEGACAAAARTTVTVYGPLDVNALVAAGSASVSTSTLDIGAASNIFDGDPATLARSASVNPMIVEVTFQAPQTLRGFRTYYSHAWGNPAYEWKVETADTPQELQAKTGSYRLAVLPVQTVSDAYSSAMLTTPIVASVVRLTARRLTGDDFVHLPEWVILGDLLPMYQVRFIAGPGGRLTGATTQLVAPGGTTAPVTAVAAPGHRFHSWTGSGVLATSANPLTVADVQSDVTAIAGFPFDPVRLVDLDVTFVERTPRYAYDAPKNMPAAGDAVTFRGHVRSWNDATASAAYRWELDGTPIASGSLLGLQPDEERVVELAWSWQAGPHLLRLTVDPAGDVAESSERNNAVEIRTDGLSAGLWVEKGVYDYFHEHQPALGIGSASWEDWAQRQLARWNQYSADAVFPLTPAGVVDRVFLDKVSVVADGELPLRGGLPGNNPDSTDRTVDLMWGFPSSLLTGTFYADHSSRSDANPFYFESSLVHELGHARYLIDDYAFDLANNPDGNQVQILENGAPVAGTALMPFLAWGSVLYYNQNGGVMTGPWAGWSPYEAGALSRIAGHRASQGNQNAPGNIGVYLADVPARNHLRFVDPFGAPLAGASVKLFQAAPAAGAVYGKVIDAVAELELTADPDGGVTIVGSPFAQGAIPVAALRVAHGGHVWYRFLEAPTFNLEYWAGNTEDARYLVELPPPGSPPRIQVEGFGSAIPPGETTASAATNTDFGAAAVGGPPVSRTFAVRNRGGSVLALTGARVTIAGPNASDFSITADPASTVTPETITTFRVTFTPSAVGARAATVVVTSSDPNQPSYRFSVQGTGR
jgi:hypothetical protein